MFNRGRFNALPILDLPLTHSLMPRRSPVTPTYSRATTGYVRDHEGVCRLALAGEARFTGARRVANLMRFTQAFSNAAWAKNSQAASTFASPDPFGGTTACRMVVDNGTSVVGNDGPGSLQQANTIPAGATVVVSCYAKADQAQVLRFRENVTTGRRAVFNLITGVITFENGATAANFPSAMVNVGNGWWRCSSVFTATSTNSDWGIKGCGAGAATTGDGVSGLFVAFAQLEDITGQAVRCPSEYTSSGVLSSPFHGAMVDGVRYFNSVMTVDQNLLANSNDLSLWAQVDAAVALVGPTAPGGLGSYTVTDNGVNSAHRINQTSTTAMSRGKLTYRGSIRIRGGTRNECLVLITDNTFSPRAARSFTDLASNTSVHANSGTMVSSSTVTVLPGGWLEVTITATFATVPNTQVHLVVYMSSSTGLAAYVGTGQTFEVSAGSLRVNALGVSDNFVITGAGPVDTFTGGSVPISGTINLGFLREPAATQLVTPTASINNLTNAAWVKSNVTTAFTSIGPDALPNTATRCTATAGNATCLQTLVAAASTRVFSCWMRRVTGTGNIELTQDNTAFTNIAGSLNTATYTLVQLSASILDASFGFRIVTSGDAVDVIFTQFEALPSGVAGASSPMTGANRNPDSLTYPIGAFSNTEGSCCAEVATQNAGSNSGNIVNVTFNEILFVAGTGTIARTNDGATSLSSVGGSAWVAGVHKKYASAWGGATRSVAARGGSSVGTGDYDLSFNPVTNYRIGESGAASANFSGNMRNIQVYNKRFTDAQLTALVA